MYVRKHTPQASNVGLRMDPQHQLYVQTTRNRVQPTGHRSKAVTIMIPNIKVMLTFKQDLIYLEPTFSFQEPQTPSNGLGISPLHSPQDGFSKI